MSTELDFAIDVAKQAGEILLSYRGKELIRNIKSDDGDFATEADHASEAFIISQIKKYFPDDSIVGEESGLHEKSGAPYTWIIDPLDGTYNFANTYENFGVMISRLKGEETELGVIYEPLKKRLVQSEKEEGVFLDNEKIILTEEGSKNKPFFIERDFQDFFRQRGIEGNSLRSSAISTILMLTGEYGGMINALGAIWDYAPAVLQLIEAGLKVTDLQGKEFKWDGQIGYDLTGFIAGHPQTHEKLLSVWQELQKVSIK